MPDTPSDVVQELRLLRKTLTEQRRTTYPYLRGDGAAAEYLQFKDVRQGRSFRQWAEAVHIPYTEIQGVRTYRKRDIDKAWERHAINQSSLVDSPAS